MFLTRKEIIIHKVKQFGEPFLGGFLVALPIMLVVILWAL